MRYRLVDAVLFGGAALVCLGLALALAYEAFAMATGGVPTISDIVASSAFTHPIWSRLAYMGAGLLIGGLAVHFGGWRP